MNGKPFKVVKYATDITARATPARLNAAFKGALDNVSANVMVADMDCNIIYMNEAARGLMTKGQADFRKELPQFDAGKLIGTRTSTCSIATRRTSATCWRSWTRPCPRS